MSQVDDLFAHAGAEDRKLIKDGKMASQTFAKLARVALWNRLQKRIDDERAASKLPPLNLRHHLQRTAPEGLTIVDEKIEAWVQYLDEHTGKHGEASVTWVANQADSLLATVRRLF